MAPRGVAIDLQHFLTSAPQIPLAFPCDNAYIIGIMRYTTQQVADLVGIDKQTLLRWLWRGEIPEPRSVQVGHIANRLWGAPDLRRAREHKKRNYRRKNRARARDGRRGRRT